MKAQTPKHISDDAMDEALSYGKQRACQVLPPRRRLSQVDDGPMVQLNVKLPSRVRERIRLAAVVHKITERELLTRLAAQLPATLDTSADWPDWIASPAGQPRDFA